MDRTGRYERSGEGSNPSGTTKIGRVIKLALDLVLKTSGTFGYGDRYLTLPLMEVVRMDEDTALKAAGWQRFGGSIPFASATGD